MSHLKTLIDLIESFEAHLGNPCMESSPIHFKTILEADEAEQLPLEPMNYIRDWGYMDYMVLKKWGGKLDSLEAHYFLSLSIARRDLTSAVALGITFLASLPIWISGLEKQQQRLAKLLRQGQTGGFMLTEEAHGSDLLANEVTAVPHQAGWLISGKKWCINAASVGHFATLLCRTHAKGGPLGFSLFLIEKSTVKSGLSYLPKLPTHGVRGLDISGLVFDKAFVPNNALIGEKKQGLRNIFKALQVSRVACTNLAKGGADTALRLTLEFARQRQLYGKPIFDIPAVKQRLAECFTYILIADCVALATLRACTMLPERMGIWSAIAKFFIPSLMESVIDECGLVLGARAYLRTTEWAMFQKIRRDSQVVGLFDGSSQINLSILADNLLPQATMREKSIPFVAPVLKRIFNLNDKPPDFTGDNLSVFNHGLDEIITAVMTIQSAPIDPLIRLIQHEIKALDQQVLQLQAHHLLDTRSLGAFRLAEKYCWLFAASCVILFWVYNHKNLPPALKNIDWLMLAITLILSHLQAGVTAIDPALQNQLADLLVDFHEEKLLFSIVPIRIEG